MDARPLLSANASVATLATVLAHAESRINRDRGGDPGHLGNRQSAHRS